MSAEIINFSAIRIARLLRQNAAPEAAADFIGHMAELARTHRDAVREAFWHEVAGLVRRAAPGLRPLSRALS
jgi:hypothetical protein